MQKRTRLTLVTMAFITIGTNIAPAIAANQDTNTIKQDGTQNHEESFFRHGTSVINGRFEGKHPEIINYYGYNGVTQESIPQVYNIADDGTFSIKLELDYPILDYFTIGNNSLYFYAVPGDTASVIIDSLGNARYSATTTNRRLLELLSNEHPELSINYKTIIKKAQKLTFGEFTSWATTQIDSLTKAADSIATGNGLSENESFLLRLNTLIHSCCDCFEYKFIRRSTNMDTDDYKFMRLLPACDIRCLTITSRLQFLVNRYIYCNPIFYMYSTKDKERLTIATDSAAMAADKAIFGIDRPSLFMQLTWTDLPEYKRNYESNPDETIKTMEERAGLMTIPYLHDLLLKYSQKLKEPRASTYALEEGEGTEIFRKLTEKYKGKYILVEFWSTSCGPCRSTIEKSKELRDSLTKEPDFELVFITSELESPIKTYDEYVKKNLQGEESLRIPDNDYKRLMALFKFTGIPHTELVAPDGRIIETDIDLREFKNTNAFHKKMDKIKAAIAKEQQQTTPDIRTGSGHL